MKKAILTAVTVISTFASFGALGQTYFGGTDCGKWVQQPTPARKAWLLGYLSGMNTMQYVTGKKQDVLDELDSAEQAFLWMDNYCKANPLQKISEGAFMLFLEIGAKGNKK